MRSYDYKSSNILSAIRQVAVYLRKSQGESEEDLDKHKSVILEICEENDWKYIIYPEIVSGDTIANRPRMIELLEDVGEEMYDAIFVFDYDRLGRGSGADQERIITTLKNSDTLVIEANPFNILDPNDERDEDTMEFKGFLARREYKMIRKRFKAGMAISLKRGDWVIGNAPYGYEINKELKRLVVKPEQKEILRKHIIEPYLNGKSSIQIVNNLRKYKIYTNTGIEWSMKAVLYALSNKTYLGHTYYNKKDKKGNLKPEHEWSVSLNTHDAIMTEEELEQVLAIKNKRHATGEKTINPLGSLIRCVNCGHSMRIRKDSGTPSVYKCENCEENKGGALEIVDDAILISLKGMKDALEKGQVIEIKKDKSSTIESEIERIKSEINKVEKAISKIEDAFEMGMYSAEKARDRLASRKLELTDLQKLLQTEKSKLNVTEEPKITLSNIDMIINKIEKEVNNKELKKLYVNLFESVVWDRTIWDEIKVTINFK